MADNDAYVKSLDIVARAIADADAGVAHFDQYVAMAAAAVAVRDEQWRARLTERAEFMESRGYEEFYGMVWFLAGGDAARVEEARQQYERGIELSPGREPAP